MQKTQRKLLEQRKELVERYVRRAIHRRAIAIGRSLARRMSRPRLQLSERKRKKALASALQTVAEAATRARRNGFHALTTVLNLGLFFLIAERDIQAVKIDALTHPEAWQRSLCARVILLTIHELDLDKVAGSALRQALHDADVPEPLRKEVAEAMRTIRRAQDKAQRQFANLRNSTIAHRDSDAIKQYRDITDIDSLEVTKIATVFYEGTHHFMDVMPKLLTHLVTFSSMLKQLSA